MFYPYFFCDARLVFVENESVVGALLIVAGSSGK